MSFKTVSILFVVCFVVFCGTLVIESGLFNSPRPAGKPCILLQQTADADKSTAANTSPNKNAQLQASDAPVFGADNAESTTVTLGSTDPESSFEFQLELTSKGAAIAYATFSRFNDRDYKDPQPLKILSPVRLPDGRTILSMANKQFVFVKHQLQLPLDKLHWKSLGIEKTGDGSQIARFETIIKDTSTGTAVIKLTKTYKVTPGSYHLDCNLNVENLSAADQRVSYNLSGPVGLGKESFRFDNRKAVAGFRNQAGKITSAKLDIKKLRKATSIEERRLAKNSDRFLWSASSNKYFAAIVVPLPDQGQTFCDWIADKTGTLYNPDGDEKAATGDEAVTVDLKIASHTLAAADEPGSTKTYNFQLYLGPKSKRIFDKNQMYRDLGFVHTIDFRACCCPVSVISPLTFFILWSMDRMYDIIGNYGIVIIILVFIIRIVIHPLTKKSQVSMSKLGSLAPKVEEIKKKYANNKSEMNKQIMALYKEQGASPVTGMLPMMVQMPIWIALFSAINASVALRGAPFLPFWITDLSVPDALFRFTAINIPILGKIDSFNLLPMLMGIAFYLQQKMMPKNATSASPQAAQQQKMMMIMMPILFPIMFYSMPSGLNLYIMASTFAGVIEQTIIKKHIREKEQAKSNGLVTVTSKTGGKVKKKKPKPFYKTH